MPAEARAAPTVRTDPLRKRRLLSAWCCSAANICSSLLVIRHSLLVSNCHSSVAFEGISSFKGPASRISGHDSGDAPRPLGLSIRRKCYESVMGIVMESGLQVLDRSEGTASIVSSVANFCKLYQLSNFSWLYSNISIG